LVVPLRNTLSSDVESRYKALTDTQARTKIIPQSAGTHICLQSIIEFLDKSRSAISHTHTTSSAPAPSLAPATVAFTATSISIIDAVHSDEGDPNKLTRLNARDLASLRQLAAGSLLVARGRSSALSGHLAEAENEIIHVSEKTKTFWQGKKEAVDGLLGVYANATKSDAELGEGDKVRREKFLAEAKEAWQVRLRDVLVKVNGDMVGPFALGDWFSPAAVPAHGLMPCCR
jgi:hypothetical protein